MIVKLKYNIYNDSSRLFSTTRIYINIKYKINDKRRVYKIDGNLYEFMSIMNEINGCGYSSSFSKEEISTLSNYIKENGMEEILRYFITLDLIKRREKDIETEDIDFICSNRGNWIELDLDKDL